MLGKEFATVYTNLNCFSPDNVSVFQDNGAMYICDYFHKKFQVQWCLILDEGFATGA